MATYGAIELTGDLQPIAARWASIDRTLRRDVLAAFKSSGERIKRTLRQNLRHVVKMRTGKTEADLGYKLIQTRNGLGVRFGPVMFRTKQSRAYIARFIEYGFRHGATERDASSGRLRTTGRLARGTSFSKVEAKPFARPTYSSEIPRAERELRSALEKVAARL